MKYHNQSFQRGTTLIELLIYIGITSILLGGITAVSMVALDAKTKSQAMSAVFFSSTEIVSTIARMTERASVILTPQTGTASNTLVLLRRDHSGADRIFVDGTRLVVSSSSSLLPLSSPAVEVSDVLFVAVGDTGTSTAARVSFRLSVGGVGVWQSFRYSNSFSTMVEVGFNR